MVQHERWSIIACEALLDYLLGTFEHILNETEQTRPKYCFDSLQCPMIQHSSLRQDYSGHLSHFDRYSQLHICVFV